MQTYTKLLLGALTAAALGTAAHAASYTITHLAGPEYRYLTQGGPAYTNTFDLTGVGFNPATEDVVWARINFAFADDAFLGDLKICGIWLGDPKEYASAVLDGETVNLGEVDGNILFYDWKTVSGSTGNLLANLQDGLLTYSVSVNCGDAWLKEVDLKACSTVTPRVPDSGSTLTLLGLSLLGLVALKRRRQK